MWETTADALFHWRKSYSDGTHSLQSIHRWDSFTAALNASHKSVWVMFWRTERQWSDDDDVDRCVGRSGALQEGSSGSVQQREDSDAALQDGEWLWFSSALWIWHLCSTVWLLYCCVVFQLSSHDAERGAEQEQMRQLMAETLLLVRSELDSVSGASGAVRMEEGQETLSLLEQYSQLLLRSVEKRLHQHT